MGDEHYGWFTWAPPSSCRGKFTWRKNQSGFIPPRALPAGKDVDGSPLFAGRAQYEGDLLPAKVRADGNSAYVAYGGKEVKVHQFEVLASHHIAWQFSHEGEINQQAMVIGTTKSGENLYMGRAYYEGSITPGKIHPTHKCLYIPFDGEEVKIKEYEIMLLL